MDPAEIVAPPPALVRILNAPPTARVPIVRSLLLPERYTLLSYMMMLLQSNDSETVRYLRQTLGGDFHAVMDLIGYEEDVYEEWRLLGLCRR